MTADVSRHSPLERRAAEIAGLGRATGGTIAAAEVAFFTQIDLRMDPSLAARLPFSLPRKPNTVAEGGGVAVLWLGPDEWLILAPPGSQGPIAGELQTALAGAHHSIVDVSANRAVLELTGVHSKDLLSKGCPVDLHPRRWRPGVCAQTIIGRAQVLLQERGASTRVFVRPSFGNYLVDWLIDAAREYMPA